MFSRFWQRTTLFLTFFSILSAIVQLWPGIAFGEETRIVDGHGLVRAVRITKGNSVQVIVALELINKAVPRGDCVAINVDGLNSEKRVPISQAKGECVFTDVASGSWQITVPPGFNWRVRIVSGHLNSSAL
jgi:hypothetical protein